MIVTALVLLGSRLEQSVPLPEILVTCWLLSSSLPKTFYTAELIIP